ncbi:replication protein [Phocoenobacter skyensis]|uniref:Phage replication protein O n=1 Tax=Phocoenobacter skyensis TaxID=97481 RepID=A0A1H7XKC5_9PAST|nr:replication protein [Pasteurella skyensis]MDP8184378.1 replication protein [Pasteurella skyensis]QLB22618.1 hypothetical protein A6B44_05120 [Pasteurella skyensis]SEM34240.1 phage replication protein O [Pasteurella skyensis]
MSNFIPNSFQIPNAFVDEMMGDLSGNSVKCYLLIARKTTGWQKESDYISISQFKTVTKIKDKRTVSDVLQELEDYGLIKCDRKKGKITKFHLEKIAFLEKDKPVAKNVPSSKKCTQLQKPQPVAKNVPSVGAKNVPSSRYKKCTSTKDNINTLLNTNNIKRGKNDILDFCLDKNVDHFLAKEFIQYRKDKKAPLTLTALKRLNSQAEKARLPLSEVLGLIMERGWQGFNADWVKSSVTKNKINFDEVIECFNNIFDGRLDYMEKDDFAETQILNLLDLLERKNIDGFRAYFEFFSENASSYYFGENKNGWKANFSFLMKPETLFKTRRGEI